MTSDQHQETRQAITKGRTPLRIAVLACIGVIDLIRAWYKHDLVDAIVVAFVFFFVTPLLVIWMSKYDWTDNR
jgi:hypothetical protein